MGQIFPHIVLRRIKDENVVLEKTMNLLIIRQYRETKGAKAILALRFHSSSKALGKVDGCR
jgi:hypothetical protein